MRLRTALLVAAALLTGCSDGGAPDRNGAAPGATGPQAGAQGRASGSGWNMQSSGEGTALVLSAAGGTAAVRLFCPAGARQLIVNVPDFRPVGSEERLSFGSGGEAHALVADARGDAQRGGVTGIGPVPANLAAMLSGTVAVSYGAQSSGPHPAPPQNLAAEFAGSCADQAGEPVAPELVSSNMPTATSACLIQDGKSVPANRLRAIGTEPFWGGRVQGRCVTYSHPDDQQGTRVWTRFSGSAAKGTWTGTLRGKPFVLRTRPQAGCSDGMSDNRYPIAVSLAVGGEQRTGCAQPL